MFPEVLRRILMEAVERGAEEEDPTLWPSKALRFGEQMTASKLPPADDDEAVEAWVDVAVDSFARKHRLLESVDAWLEGDE